MIEIALPAQLEGTVAGFEALGRIAADMEPLVAEEVRLRGLSQWCDGHLCAALGALLYRAAQNLNSFEFSEEVGGRVLEVWAKNGFWRHFGGVDMVDTFDTTLAYDHFDRDDEKRFAVYVQRELMPKELPRLAPSARQRFRSSVQEAFNNAGMHSQTELGIFACGQNYPTRDRLSFSVADLGVGFRANVESFLGQQMAAGEAITWALVEGHTTKRGPQPGGLGLAWLWEFVQHNGGELQIVSHADCWIGQPEGVSMVTLRHPFPGTIVTLHINTRDEGSPGRLDAATVSDDEGDSLF